MKKNDLKDFDIVEFRNGKRMVVVGDNLISKNGFLGNYLKDYTNDLTFITGADYDIVKVWRFGFVKSVVRCLKGGDFIPIWQRPEIPEYTYEELIDMIGWEKFIKMLGIGEFKIKK